MTSKWFKWSSISEKLCCYYYSFLSLFSSLCLRTQIHWKPLLCHSTFFRKRYCYFNWCQMSNYLLNTIFDICIFQLTRNKAAWYICNELPAAVQIPFTLKNRSVCPLSASINLDLLLLLLVTFLSLTAILTVTTVTEYLFVWEIKT